MIVAQVSVRQHIVADPLAGTKTAAMANHQPGLGAHDREVVADRLGIGRADADIDQRDAGAVFGDQVIGGHLVPPPRAVGDDLVDIFRPLNHDPARTRQGGEARPLAQLRCTPANEFIDIAVIVGEQHEALTMLWRGAGVVT